MKNTIALSLLLSLIGGVLVSTPAEANYKNRVNHRQYRQEKRLYNGVQSGALNGREYRRLQKKQTALAIQEAKFRASGNGLSKNEAARLEVEQDRLSKNIYGQKHDGQSK